MNSDEKALEAAYRTASGWLRESGLTSEIIPRFKDPNSLTALKLKATIEEHDAEIKRLRDVLAGRIKPKVTIVRPPLENKSAAYIKAVKETSRKEKETIEKGIKTLEKRRRIYARKLRIVKLRQFEVNSTIEEAEKINKQAHETLNKIQELKKAIKEEIGKFTELQARYNGLHEKFQKINLDPNRSFPRLNAEIPRRIVEFAEKLA
jgi:chromosome segregation ATPase